MNVVKKVDEPEPVVEGEEVVSEPEPVVEPEEQEPEEPEPVEPEEDPLEVEARRYTGPLANLVITIMEGGMDVFQVRQHDRLREFFDCSAMSHQE